MSEVSLSPTSRIRQVALRVKPFIMTEKTLCLLGDGEVLLACFWIY